MELKFSNKGTNYRFQWDWSKAPDFCAMHFLHNFYVVESTVETRKPAYWDPRFDGKWVPKKPWAEKTFEEAAVECVQQTLREDRGTKLLLCDIVDGDMSDFVIAYLKKLKKPITVDGKVYEVKCEKPYTNFNTGHKVQECVLRRIK